MENDRQKWVYLSFLAVSALVSYIAYALLYRLAGSYDLEALIRRFIELDVFVTLLSVFIGLILFLYLYRSDPTNQFMNEVVAELSRVTWPTPKDTFRATAVVMIMVIICGIMLGFIDSIWTWALRLVL